MASDPYDGRTRVEYLCNLAAEYEVDVDLVMLAAEMLGPNEDFDGLLNELEDLSTRRLEY